jgi:hypothetical protein
MDALQAAAAAAAPRLKPTSPNGRGAAHPRCRLNAVGWICHPHGNKGVSTVDLSLVRFAAPVDFGTDDSPVRFLFVVFAPGTADGVPKILSQIARVEVNRRGLPRRPTDDSRRSAERGGRGRTVNPMGADFRATLFEDEGCGHEARGQPRAARSAVDHQSSPPEAGARLAATCRMPPGCVVLGESEYLPDDHEPRAASRLTGWWSSMPCINSAKAAAVRRGADR